MPSIPIDQTQLSDFCRRWQITELALFGSVLRDDFGPDSDVDVLVNYAPEARWTLLDLARIQDELSEMWGRQVDILTRPGVEHSTNPIRRQEILSTAEVIIHAA